VAIRAFRGDYGQVEVFDGKKEDMQNSSTLAINPYVVGSKQDMACKQCCEQGLVLQGQSEGQGLDVRTRSRTALDYRV